MEDKETYAQDAIKKRIKEKIQPHLFFQDHWGEYDDYGDYNDCHGDYYDADCQ